MKNAKKKVLITILSALIVMMSPTIANATDKTVDEAMAWVQSQVGTALDYDGAYGAQCVDLIKYYYAYLGVAPVHGNGCDYATNSLPSGWQRLQGATPQRGDILVYSAASTNGWAGHVAIYESDYSHYNQNVKGKYGVVKCTWHYASVEPYWGVIRPDFSGSSVGTIIDGSTYTARVSGTDGNLAINSSPNAYSQVGTIPEGATCTVYPNQTSGNWLWVTYNGISGYSYNKYLIKTDNPAPPTDGSSNGNGGRTYAARVAGTDGHLAINSSPNAYSQVGVIPEGATCTVYPDQASGNWLWVTYNGISGYSYNRYLIEVSNEAVVSTLEPTPVPTPEPTPVPTSTPTPKPTPTPIVKPTPTLNIDDYNKVDYQPSVLTVFSGNKLQIAVDDTLVRFPDAQPFIDSNDRTQVPILAVSEMLNCDVEWISETHTAIITRENGDSIIIVIGSNTMLVNNNKVKMDTAALIKDDRTYIPVRFVAEALGLTVEWV